MRSERGRRKCGRVPSTDTGRIIPSQPNQAFTVPQQQTERFCTVNRCGEHRAQNTNRNGAAVRAAIVYSLVDSCKAMDVNPREWMEDVMLRISGNENNREALRELMPCKWAKQTNQNQLDPTLANLNKMPPTWNQKYKLYLIGCLHTTHLQLTLWI